MFEKGSNPLKALLILGRLICKMLGDCLEGLICRGDDDGGRLDRKSR